MYNYSQANDVHRLTIFVIATSNDTLHNSSELLVKKH